MNAKAKAILAQALKLPRKIRVELAEKLLESLDEECDQETLEAVGREAEKRWRAYKKGEIRAIPAEEIFPSLKKGPTR